MKTTDTTVMVDQIVADNKDLFRDSESAAESEARKRKFILLYLIHLLKCDYPCWLCCFCLNPLQCMKSLQAVILNWLGILAAVTLVSLYWNSTMLVLFSVNVGYFMFLGLGCLWTAITLVHYMGKISTLGKNLDESVTKMLHTEADMDKTIDLLDIANDRWLDRLDDFHDVNAEIRVVGRRLDRRKDQAETQTEQLKELLIKYGGRVTADVLRRREAIDNLISEQINTLDQMDENVGDMQHEQIEFNEHVLEFQEDLEHLNETICTINKPIDKLESFTPNLHRLGADARECEAFLSGHIQYLSVLERITILREMTYSQSIFFNALRENDGQIEERLFNELMSRLPKSLRDAHDKNAYRYKDYRCVLSKRKLGRTKYGGMDEASVIKFMKDLEAVAFQMELRHSSNMPNPSRFGYEVTEEEEGSGEDMQQHTSSEDIFGEEEEEEETETIIFR